MPISFPFLIIFLDFLLVQPASERARSHKHLADFCVRKKLCLSISFENLMLLRQEMIPLCFLFGVFSFLLGGGDAFCLEIFARRSKVRGSIFGWER